MHGVVAGGEAPVLELYASLHAYLPARYPDIFTQKAGQLHNRLTGAAFLLSERDPGQALRSIATTVEEDFFVLVLEPAGHRCVGFVCCFPSGFDPASKLGKGLAAIHAPVPSYERIGPSMERFFARVQVGRPVTRMNWAVQVDGVLFNSGSNHITGEGEEDVDPDAVDVSQVRTPFSFGAAVSLLLGGTASLNHGDPALPRSRADPSATSASSTRRSRASRRRTRSSSPSRRTCTRSRRCAPRASARRSRTRSRDCSAATRPACGRTRRPCGGGRRASSSCARAREAVCSV